METVLLRLRERVARLGNHNQKYLRMIDLHLDSLVERLEASGTIDQVHLWTTGRDLRAEMEVVCAQGESEKERLEFLGTYFALQFLHLNLRALDVLMLDLSATNEPLQVYQKFMLDVGARLRALIATYMEKLLDLFLPADQRPEFVICGVGTRTDQDDLDIGVIDDGSSKREYLNRAVSKLSGEMFKRAVCLHMHISEHVGQSGFSASIPEYCALLDSEIRDFVIISEMLNAAPIIGSRRLFRQFQRQVTGRYYYHRRGDNRYHEGYLRGILGEVRSLQIRRLKPNRINLKNDALRMIKGALFAGKTIFRIDKVNCWAILYELWKRDAPRAAMYAALEESLTFLEIFRYLYQLFVVQEEEIYLETEQAKTVLADVARAMGYEGTGVVSAEQHLLVDYYRYVAQAKRAIDELVPHVTQHLRSVTVFAGLREEALAPCRERPAGNLAVRFVQHLEFFNGTKFWDDVLEAVEDNQAELLVALIKDLCAVEEPQGRELVRRFAAWGANAFIAALSFLVMLDRHRHHFPSRCVFEDFNGAFLDVFAGSPEEIRRMVRVFDHYPQLMNRYLSCLSEADREVFARKMCGEAWDPDVAQVRARLLELCDLHIHSSQYFKRFFLRVMERHPAAIHLIDQPAQLQQLAEGLYGDVDRYGAFTAKKERLGDFFDVEFFRLGLLCLAGAPIRAVNAQFTESSDRYLRTLFDLCKAEVDEQLGSGVVTKDLLALFVSGGHAREQAFVDDYDLFFLLDADDPKLRAYGDKIASRMNQQLIRRGILPHYRFADLFGHYVTTMNELDSYLAQDDGAVVVDKSQVLGSRMVVGSTKLQQAFVRRIIEPHVYDRVHTYLAQMQREIHSRHREARKLPGAPRNIKEGLGGMRDIEMTLLMCKAKYRIEQPVTFKLLEALLEVAPEWRKELVALREAIDFYEQLRSLYRLTASSADEIDPRFLNRAAVIMGYGDGETDAADRLMAAFASCAQKTRRVLARLERFLVPTPVHAS
ncbi:MAG: DUF294 nucleotidyltransferase-like domain-containing protein [candidate division KSB1 bacterium]|nr:DUF294 nucleotidyltransferase-like domain-containing protein [candidate division KSB1 bacterium]